MTELPKMWEALDTHQPIADTYRYGPAWARMCAEKTKEAADAAYVRAVASNAAYAAAARASASAAVAASASAAVYVAQVIDSISKANDASTYLKNRIKKNT